MDLNLEEEASLSLSSSGDHLFFAFRRRERLVEMFWLQPGPMLPCDTDPGVGLCRMVWGGKS